AACGAPSHPKAVIELVGPLQVETYLIPSQDVLSQRMVVTACGSPVGLTKYGTTMSAVFSRATSAWEGFFGPEGEERLAGLRLTGVNVPVDTTISYQPGATDSALSLTWHFLSRILLQPGNRAEFMVRMNVVGGPESSPASIEACYQMNLGSFEVLDLNTAEAATALWAGSGTPMQTCFVTP
ncbi:hypothetical protein HY632_03125, partial [Candidatus Uhrbacteria bacterium]|nr:hypothetical protein [Candidatus Uhrbacteria bacterium]